VRQFLEVATGEYILPLSEDNSEMENKEEEEKPNQQGEDFDSQVVKGPLRAAEIFEIDVDGLRRPWEPVRDGESKYTAKRWCVVAVLVRK